MTELSYLAVIDFRGADALDFLHRQVSADLKRLHASEAGFAFLCRPNGRVVALLLVHLLGQGPRVLCHRDLADTVVAGLQKFVLRDDVEIRRRDDLRVYGTEQAQADAAVPLPGLGYLTRATAPGAGGNTDDWRRHELAAGVAWLDRASSEAFLPQSLGGEAIGALSFRKGCFPGQEIIARTRYLGQLKRLGLRAETDQPVTPETMDTVVLAGDAGQEAKADVVEWAPGPGGGSTLLLVARTAAPFAVTGLLWADRRYPATVQWLTVGARQASATT